MVKRGFQNVTHADKTIFYLNDCSGGGLEGDRTLEPHRCEPCALPSVTVITDRKQGKMCQKPIESRKGGCFFMRRGRGVTRLPDR